MVLSFVSNRFLSCIECRISISEVPSHRDSISHSLVVYVCVYFVGNRQRLAKKSHLSYVSLFMVIRVRPFITCRRHDAHIAQSNASSENSDTIRVYFIFSKPQHYSLLTLNAKSKRSANEIPLSLSCSSVADNKTNSANNNNT